MSEKRFRANFDVSIYDAETEEYISASGNGLKEIVKLLNEQQSTIDKLRVDIRATRTTIEHLNNECKGLVSMFEEEVKENEQLKQELHIVETDCKNAKESRDHYRTENKHLKEQLQECKKKGA